MAKKQHQPIPDVVMNFTPRMSSNDCAIWSLKTLIGRTYPEVMDAVRAVDKKHEGTQGLWWSQVIKAAKRLKVRLRVKPKADIEADTGILSVQFPQDDGGESHAVVLMQGPIILDSDGTVWQAEDYIAHNKVIPGSILVIDE